MFKTVLVIYYFAQHFNTARSETWSQNEQRLNSSTFSVDSSRSRDPSFNGSKDIVTAVLININTGGAPRALNSTNSRHRKRNIPSQRITRPNRRIEFSRGDSSHLVYHSTSSNPKNDVEVFGPLDGTPPPGYGPQAPQPPNFPPSLPDYPPSIYPYEPPYYYPVYSDDVPSYQPYYPPIFPMNPMYPTLQPQLPPATPSHRNYPEYTTVVRAHETEPTTSSTLNPPGQKPAKEPEPEVIIPRAKKPISRVKPTKSPTHSTPKVTSSRVPKTSSWPYFHTKSHTTTQSYGPKFTAKRQTLNYQTTTQRYPYDQYTTTPVYNVLNYSPASADPRAAFYPWTTKKQAAPVPPSIFPYLTGNNIPGYAVFPGYQQAYFEPPAVQIGGRRRNTTASEKLSNPTWMPQTRKVEIVGAPSALDPKFKLAVVSNYENLNETAGTFGFDIDLENGLTIGIRGYKKNGKQRLEGSFSLFTNEGEPVRITYTADNDDDDDETETSTMNATTTDTPESKVPIDESKNSTTEQEEASVATTTEFLTN